MKKLSILALALSVLAVSCNDKLFLEECEKNEYILFHKRRFLSYFLLGAVKDTFTPKVKVL